MILAKDLLEHVPRTDILLFLRGVHSALRPGGVFLCASAEHGQLSGGDVAYDDFTHRLGSTENTLPHVFTLVGFERNYMAVVNDVVPGWPLAEERLLRAVFLEKLLGPLVRLVARLTLLSQRKGLPRVDTLRVIVRVRVRA